MEVNGKDYPIYYGKYKMFETTNQLPNTNQKKSPRSTIRPGDARRHLHKPRGRVLREAAAKVPSGTKGRQGSAVVAAVLVEDLGLS